MKNVKFIPIIIYFVVSGFINVVSQISQAVFSMVNENMPIESIDWSDFGQVQLFILVAGGLANAMHSAYGRYTTSAGGDSGTEYMEALNEQNDVRIGALTNTIQNYLNQEKEIGK
tara:strand:+ start:321 stop:665 length:345 start_codon:yes stop_codon:yes gene_type:complete